MPHPLNPIIAQRRSQLPDQVKMMLVWMVFNLTPNLKSSINKNNNWGQCVLLRPTMIVYDSNIESGGIPN